MKNNKKYIKKVSIVIICIVITFGIVYAGIIKYNNLKMFPTYTGKKLDANNNNIWIGSFQLAWNDFMDQIIGGNIEFENGNSDLLNELNKKSFTKDMISENNYYVEVGKTNPDLKSKIIKNLKNKFNINDSLILKDINFDNVNNGYTIYSLLYKNIEFIEPLDKLNSSYFGDNKEEYDNQKVKYFGIDRSSNKKLKNSVDILFYNNNSDFAVKLKSKSNDEIILYRTDKLDSFDSIYKDALEKESKYDGDKLFEKSDELEIPYISINTAISYDELCQKNIKGQNGMFIENAVQNVIFSLNEKGASIFSESTIKSTYLSIPKRAFFFDNKFILFVKEKDKNNPYFALRIDNSDFLVKSESDK